MSYLEHRHLHGQQLIGSEHRSKLQEIALDVGDDEVTKGEGRGAGEHVQVSEVRVSEFKTDTKNISLLKMHAWRHYEKATGTPPG